MADGKETVNIEDSSIREVLAKLQIVCPELKEIIESGVSVVVDGKVIANDLTTEVSEKSEVYLIQKLRGGQVFTLAEDYIISKRSRKAM